LLVFSAFFYYYFGQISLDFSVSFLVDSTLIVFLVLKVVNAGADNLVVVVVWDGENSEQ